MFRFFFTVLPLCVVCYVLLCVDGGRRLEKRQRTPHLLGGKKNTHQGTRVSYLGGCIANSTPVLLLRIIQTMVLVE